MRLVLAFLSVKVVVVYHDYGGKVFVFSVKELSWFLNPAPRGKRYILVLFTFACDESYDSPKGKVPQGSPPFEPNTYVVAGFFADENTWARVERRWNNANLRYGVPRYHASHLNAKTYEYEGWSDPQKIRYSRQMLAIIKDQKKKMHAVSCGVLADEYRNIINEKGREKFGVPYLACFKTCVALIAKEMDGFPPGDQFAVVLDRNDLQIEAVKIFYELQSDPGFKYRSRLADCMPAANEDITALQPADFIAYETFRLLQKKRNGDEKVRYVLQSTFNTNGFTGYYFGADAFTRMKEPMESATCRPNGFVVNMPSVEEALRAKRAGA